MCRQTMFHMCVHTPLDTGDGEGEQAPFLFSTHKHKGILSHLSSPLSPLLPIALLCLYPLHVAKHQQKRGEGTDRHPTLSKAAGFDLCARAPLVPYQQEDSPVLATRYW